MNIVFKTQVDAYKVNPWPTCLTIPPRIGETVLVGQEWGNYFSDRNLPLRMEVKDVTWSDVGVIVELWYKDIDIKIANQNGTNLFP